MAVYIYQADALDKLAAVEGQAWKEQQGRHTSSPYGFYAWLLAWQHKYAAGADYVDEPVGDFLEQSGDGVIYGEGGYSRYAVRPDGEIILLGASTREAKRALAEQHGITVR